MKKRKRRRKRSWNKSSRFKSIQLSKETTAMIEANKYEVVFEDEDVDMDMDKDKAGGPMTMATTTSKEEKSQ